jgi:hypothetical protein
VQCEFVCNVIHGVCTVLCTLSSLCFSEYICVVCVRHWNILLIEI